MISEERDVMTAVQYSALSIAAFCKAYGIGKTKAYAEIAAGRLEAKKIGTRTVVLSEDAARWAQSLPSIGKA